MKVVDRLEATDAARATVANPAAATRPFSRQTIRGIHDREP